MNRVATSFVDVMVRAAGLRLADDGTVHLADGVVYRMARPRAGFFDESEHIKLVEWIQGTAEDEHTFIATFSNIVRPEDLGVLGLALKTAPTVGASLKLIEKYFHLVADDPVFRLEVHGGQALMIAGEVPSSDFAVQLRNECALAALVYCMRLAADAPVPLDFVKLAHPCRSCPSCYLDHFECDVRFGGGNNIIGLPSAALELPNVLGDKAIFDFLSEQLEGEAAALDRSPTFVTKLLTSLREKLKDGVPQAHEIAREMGLSERTFYRRLAHEGMTFRGALLSAQTDLARELLSAGNHTIAEVAFLTGFSEQSTFSRAFKRSVGQPPGQYRQAASLPPSQLVCYSATWG